MDEPQKRVVPLRKLVYCKYIIRNGRRIYPKKGKCFRFWMKIKPNA